MRMIPLAPSLDAVLLAVVLSVTFALAPARAEESTKAAAAKDGETQKSSEETKKNADVVADKIPPGWIKAGSAPNAYYMGVDDKVKHDGARSGFIASKTDHVDGFGTLMQMIASKEYSGKRLCLSGWIKTENATGWASMWMRVDGAKEGETLAFDNMQDRPVKGTTDWKSAKIVLDVPKEARVIAFGLMLIGGGKVWGDGFDLKVVSLSEAQTGSTEPGLNIQPSNLNFDKE